MSRCLRALCISLFFAAPVSASTVFTGSTFRIDASTPVQVGNASKAVTLTAVALGSFNPNAFDGISGGRTGITTTLPLLHQFWENGGTTQTPTNDLQPGNLPFQAIDTHFLVNNANILVSPGGTPNEDKTLLVSPENANAGYGSHLTGAFTLAGAPASTWNFAYLVTPVGTLVNLNFLLGGSSEASGTSEIVNTSFLVVPEPTGMALLAMALAGLLCARARRVS